MFVLVRRQADAMAHCCQCETYLPRICRYCFANISTGRYWDPKESSPCELELTILGIVELPRFLVQVICSLYTLNVATHGMSTRKSCCFGSCSSSMWMSKQDLALTLKQKQKSSALRELFLQHSVFHSPLSAQGSWRAYVRRALPVTLHPVCHEWNFPLNCSV